MYIAPQFSVFMVNKPGVLALALGEIQQLLFVLGADLASPRPTPSEKTPRISGTHVTSLEQSIDRLDAGLKPLKEFVLPGGSPLAAQLHVARTVCRRAEREVVELSRSEDLGSDVIPFLNRLSDLLFTMARTANRDAHVEEITWSGREE